MTDITRLTNAQIQLDKFLLVRLHEGISQYGELYDAAAGAFPGNAVALWYEVREPLVHGRVVIDGATYMADLSDDRNQLVARIGYRLKVGWKPQRPRRVEERRPRDGWAEEVAWG